MDDEFDDLFPIFMTTILITLGSGLAIYRGKTRRKRMSNVRPLNRNRNDAGFYKSLFLHMKSDPIQFFKYTRMDIDTFQKLVLLLTPALKKHTKDLPNNIYGEQRIALTLHYLSQGSSLQTIAWKYHMGISTVHTIVKEVCTAIWTILSPIYLKAPNCTERWLQISEEFMSTWNFPNCVGSIDGKHINLRCPGNTGSQFFNYKKTFSIVLMAACDAKYNFTLVDIGAYGSQSDGGIFKKSAFGAAILENKMCIPNPKNIPGINILFPHVFVADKAFPLTTFIMRPYPGKFLPDDKRMFNYRLCRARRIIENTFGILSSRWRILLTTINASVENTESIVKATVCLHNFVKKECRQSIYNPPGFVDSDDVENGLWRREKRRLQSVGRLSSNVACRSVVQLRDDLKNYFITTGQVPWQNQRVFGI